MMWGPWLAHRTADICWSMWQQLGVADGPWSGMRFWLGPAGASQFALCCTLLLDWQAIARVVLRHGSCTFGIWHQNVPELYCAQRFARGRGRGARREPHRARQLTRGWAGRASVPLGLPAASPSLRQVHLRPQPALPACSLRWAPPCLQLPLRGPLHTTGENAGALPRACGGRHWRARPPPHWAPRHPRRCWSQQLGYWGQQPPPAGARGGSEVGADARRSGRAGRATVCGSDWVAHLAQCSGRSATAESTICRGRDRRRGWGQGRQL